MDNTVLVFGGLTAVCALILIHAGNKKVYAHGSEAQKGLAILIVGCSTMIGALVVALWLLG